MGSRRRGPGMELWLVTSRYKSRVGRMMLVAVRELGGRGALLMRCVRLVRLLLLLLEILGLKSPRIASRLSRCR
jgi:hypothetical protein